MKPKIALITGANKGLGFETARQLGKNGVIVLIGARDKAKGEAAAALLKSEEIDARFLEIDVTYESSIVRAAKEIESQFGALDILVNNAGVLVAGSDGAPSTTTVATFKTTFETNVFGLIAVTQVMLPLLKKSAGGRIVNLSSVLGSIAEHADPNSSIHGMLVSAYNCSKAAVNMFTNQLALELRETKIKVNAVHPGWVKTDMGGEAAPMDIPDGAKSSVEMALIDESGPSGGFYHMGVHMRW
jgi:NAD(P)-dependent dehydrogenase (short-subunit alcohol dehydrogenase family)